MTIVLVASGFGQETSYLVEPLQSLLDKSYTIHPLNWHLSGGPQKLMDLLDTRNGKKVIIEMSEKIIDHLTYAEENNEDASIVSFSAGSRIVEEALSIIDGLDKMKINVRHIMIAPAISGTEWGGIGKFASAALSIGLGTLGYKLGKGKTGVLAGILGVLGGISLVSRETVLDVISDPGEDLHYAEIERHILYSESDEIVRPPDNVKNANYYETDSNHSSLGKLQGKYLNQKFRYKSFFMERVKTKRELLQGLI